MEKEREIVLVRLRDEEQRKEVTGKEKNLKDRKERIRKIGPGRRRKWRLKEITRKEERNGV